MSLLMAGGLELKDLLFHVLYYQLNLEMGSSEFWR